MAFKYKMALFYKMAREKEKQEQLELGRLMQERLGLCHRISEISSKMNYWYGQYDVQSWDPKETGLIENHLSFIDSQKQLVLSKLRELEGEIAVKRAEVNEAHKNKKKYEIHEGYQRDSYNEAEKSKETRSMNDIIQMSYLRKRNEGALA